MNRSIVDQRCEHLSNTTKRVHIAIGDQLMSDLGIYLALGTTAIVIKMIDSGACVGPAYELADAIEALRILDCDPDWKKPLPLANGLTASGLEIQEHYLRCAEEYTKKEKHPWMERVVSLWRSTLDLLRVFQPPCVPHPSRDSYPSYKGCTFPDCPASLTHKERSRSMPSKSLAQGGGRIDVLASDILLD